MNNTPPNVIILYADDLGGSYPWRNPNAAVLPGDAAQIISKDQPTLPKMFKTQGYNTGIVGKWHLGLGDGKLDFNKSISGWPPPMTVYLVCISTIAM